MMKVGEWVYYLQLIPLFFVKHITITTMVYINDASGTITIPKHTETTGTYTLKLTSNLSDEVVLVDNGGDISTNSLYYKFTLGSLSNLNVGEYTYKLFDNTLKDVVEVGLLTFGTFKRQVIVNNTFNKEKIQYNG